MLEMKQLAQCTEGLTLVVQMIWTILTYLHFFEWFYWEVVKASVSHYLMFFEYFHPFTLLVLFFHSNMP